MMKVADIVFPAYIAAPINDKSITTYTVESNVTFIAPRVFIDCKNLRMIDVSLDNPEYCSLNGILYNKTSNVLHTCPRRYETGKIEIPATTRRIGDYAFAWHNIPLRIVFNEWLEEIGTYAFFSTTIDEVVIPEGVHTIGYGAFDGTEIERMVIPSSVTSIGGRALPYETEYVVKKNSYACQYLQNQNAVFGDVFGKIKITLV